MRGLRAKFGPGGGGGGGGGVRVYEDGLHPHCTPCHLATLSYNDAANKKGRTSQP